MMGRDWPCELGIVGDDGVGNMWRGNFQDSGNIKANVLEGGMTGRCESEGQLFQMELVRTA